VNRLTNEDRNMMAPAPGDSRAGIELSLIVPVKDEEQSVAAFVERTAPVLDRVLPSAGHGHTWEILFVDDGSSDGTMAAIHAAHRSDPRIRALSLSRNFGKEAALSAGLDFAAGRAVVPIDVDLQDPPEVIEQMLAKWREGHEIVYGVRSNRSSDSLPKRLTADLYYRAHNYLASDKIPEHAGDFRLLDRAVVEVIRKMPERNRFMKGLFAWSGFRQAAVEYEREPRRAGTTKFRYWRLWTLALDGITSASTVPLRIWSYMGVVVALLSLIYAAYLVIRTTVSGIDLPGYASLMVAILFLGGVQLMSLGVLGEYVGRILVETKQRPIYVVRETLGLDSEPSQPTGSGG
jgi:glycosyltransferase involved in cell wall biosynthesis